MQEIKSHCVTVFGRMASECALSQVDVLRCLHNMVVPLTDDNLTRSEH